MISVNLVSLQIKNIVCIIELYKVITITTNFWEIDLGDSRKIVIWKFQILSKLGIWLCIKDLQCAISERWNEI